MKGNPEPVKPRLQFQTVQAQKLGGLPEADLAGQIRSQSLGIGIFRFLRALMVTHRALRESLEEPEVQRVQKHDLLLTGPFHDRHLSALNAVYDLLGVLG